MCVCHLCVTFVFLLQKNSFFIIFKEKKRVLSRLDNLIYMRKFTTDPYRISYQKNNNLVVVVVVWQGDAI